MDEVPVVVEAAFAGEFRIRITFRDGQSKTVDLGHRLRGPIFQPLKDPAYFQTFFVANGTVSWPNGADFAPETLYELPAVEVAA